eukprot:CAMPEP_0117033816 /NCGR_PEP_ID=MMETSP0472-20121206/24133_1 /TAXON_ID=693140 ORGANISM="Tiarina fusus, Strain LIS" /NCGR_SAMPLE_ID=MMETSP0472 /ASSEMBLY_ACC=CAM_ASM_000603 /LENGTH=359 /DNA_ID=CAMNT_0004742837 /DNA_START=207 /DNA_END=1283 /DNA_ORIENTATION=+
MAAKYGPVYHMNVFGSQWVVISDYGLFQEVVRNRDLFPNDAKVQEAAALCMGRSMFASEGKLWDEKHNIILPFMNQKMLETTAIVTQNKAVQLLEAIELEKSPEGKVEVISLMKRLTLDVIGEMAFGVDFEAMTPKQRKFDGMSFSELAEMQLNAIRSRCTSIPKYLWNAPLPIFKKEQKAAFILRKMFDGLLEQAKEKLDKGEDSNNLPSLIIKAREADPNVANNIYPREDILGESFSVFAAGHDTTQFTSVHLIKLLAIHQDIQDKLRDEILKLEASLDGKEPSAAQISRCSYMSLVIKESQRVYVIAPFRIRQAIAATSIGGYPIPKNTSVVIDLYSIHMNEKYFKNPEQFIPERW